MMTPAIGINPRMKIINPITMTLGTPRMLKPIIIKMVLIKAMINCTSMTLPKIKMNVRPSS